MESRIVPNPLSIDIKLFVTYIKNLCKFKLLDQVLSPKVVTFV